MKKGIMLVIGLIALSTAGAASAHFGMIIPSDQMVMPDDPRQIELDLRFWHPFENIGMNLEKPARFCVVANGQKVDLLVDLRPFQVDKFRTWKARYTVSRPGVHIFYMEPQPYWEPTEDCFIVHLTKVVVTAFGDDEGWDAELGLKTEIVPLSKPFGLYAGNVFQGIVKWNGKPVPYAEVEVEYYNEKQTCKAPTDYMITQALKADGSGVFTYAAPMAGWWGFAALGTSEERMKQDGQDKDVEIGAVIWVQFHEMK